MRVLLAEDEFIRHQVHDLPPLKLEVTQGCPIKKTVAKLSEE